MLPNKFTVRVYGILRNKHGNILLSQEQIGNFPFTKFPGGGLEFGEGPEDCVVREFKEETGLEVFCCKHIYTSGFFVQSQIVPEEQVIGIYYEVKPVDEKFDLGMLDLNVKLSEFRGKANNISHIWESPKMLIEDLLTFEIDKVALAEYKKSLLK